MSDKRKIFIIYLLSFIVLGCSFDYGNTGGEENELPDIVMEDVEYVRVRGGSPQVRFRAEKVERYDDKQKMELRNFSFEQFGSRGKDVNAEGRAGAASVDLDSGNILMDRGVRIDVESEDLVIETGELSWKDKERVLAGQDSTEVEIRRSDGTFFTGRGFSADARNRTWVFSGGASGAYVHEDDDEEEEEDGE